jgi:hypothetical protein
VAREDDLTSFREERETLERWRNYSYHVIANLLEACSACNRVRERTRLTHCRYCHDVYYCQDGMCAYIHHAQAHPSDTIWLK